MEPLLPGKEPVFERNADPTKNVFGPTAENLNKKD
jgi:hypothetical protein